MLHNPGFRAHTQLHMISNTPNKFWQHVGASTRLCIVSVAGIIAYLFLPPTLSIEIRLVLAWLVAASIYLFLSFAMIYFSTREDMLALCKKEDDGAPIILLLTVFGAVASLGAIVMILSDARTMTAGVWAWHIGLVLLTFTLSWLLVHTAFALRYSHLYYREFEKTQIPPLIFPSDPRPKYSDFLYFSMVIGMTCQTADVNIASSRMRFLVMIQGLIAFIFNTSLLALAINLISGVVAAK